MAWSFFSTQICCCSPCSQFLLLRKAALRVPSISSHVSRPLFTVAQKHEHAGKTYSKTSGVLNRKMNFTWHSMSAWLSLCGWPTSAGFSFLDCRMNPEVPSTSKSCMILWLKHLVTAILFEAQELFLLNFAFPALSLNVDIELMARQVSCWSTALGSKQSTISPTQFWAPKALKGCLKTCLGQIHLPEKLDLNCGEAV